MTEEEVDSEASSNNTMVPYIITNPAALSNNTMVQHIDTTTAITTITNSNPTANPLHRCTQISSWSVVLYLLLIMIIETPRSVLICCCSMDSFTTHYIELRRSKKMASHYKRKYQHQSGYQQTFLSSQEATELAIFWYDQATNARKGRGSLEQDA